MSLLLFILVGVALTNLIVNASVLESIRMLISLRSEFFGTLVTCMLCSGFWVGLILNLTTLGFYSQFGVLSFIIAAGLISLFSHFYDVLTDYLLCDRGDNETEK